MKTRDQTKPNQDARYLPKPGRGAASSRRATSPLLECKSRTLPAHSESDMPLTYPSRTTSPIKYTRSPSGYVCTSVTSPCTPGRKGFEDRVRTTPVNDSGSRSSTLPLADTFNLIFPRLGSCTPGNQLLAAEETGGTHQIQSHGSAQSDDLLFAPPPRPTYVQGETDVPFPSFVSLSSLAVR